MTIMEALERAKLHAHARRQQAGVTDDSKQLPPDESQQPAEVAPPSVRLAPRKEYPALQRVQLDTAVCASNRVLLDATGDSRSIEQAQVAYRMLRSRVKNRAAAGNWHVFSFTSPGPGEGKTVTALNAAISIAREKRRDVYLLDLDMRNPSAMRYVGARAPRSLSDYLAGDCTPDDVLFATSLECLIVAGANEPVQNASELLARPELERLLTYIQSRSPDAMIILDLPPVLNSDEALVVAPHVSATILVVSEGVTRREALARTVEQLRGFTIGGVVLNRSNVWGFGPKYGDTYGYPART